MTSLLHDITYFQETGNEQWNANTPTLEWKSTEWSPNKLDTSFLPYLCDVVIHLGESMYYCHASKLASGPCGSYYLANVIAMNRAKQSESSVTLLDISKLLPAPSATQSFNAILDYMYTGNTEFPRNALASTVVTSYVLRIKSLFEVSKQQLLAALEGKGVGSAIEILTDAQKITVTEDTNDLIAAIVSLAKTKINSSGASNSGGGATSVKTNRKNFRRRASYKAAMNTVHKKNLGVVARVKPAAPGRLAEGYSEREFVDKGNNENGNETKTKTKETNSKTTQNEIQEHVVGIDHRPGKRIAAVHKGRRFSFTVPQGAEVGDILKVVVPKPKFAQPKNFAPPPPNALKHTPPPPPKGEKGCFVDPREALAYVYKDADNEMFGPFDRAMMKGWFDGSMIPKTLRIRPSQREDLEFVAIEKFFGPEVQPFFNISSETA